MASKTLTLNKLVSSDFSEGSSWVLNKGGGGDTDTGYFVFNGLGVDNAKITKVSFKINAIETGGNNLLAENIYLNFEFGWYLGSTFAKSTAFSFSQLGVKESENQVSRTATASGSQSVSANDPLCIKMTVTPQSNLIGSKIVMSGFSLIVTYEVQSYTVTVNVNPAEGGSVKGGGSYAPGSTATVTAVPNEGYKFSGWANQSGVITVTKNPYSFTVNNNTTFSAVFEKLPTYTISTVASPTEGGTTSGGGTFYEGSRVPITATPNKGYEFYRWEYCDVGSVVHIYEASTEVDVIENTTYTAYFKKLPPEFTSAEMTYLSKQISASNKVIHGEGFIISVGIT